MSSSSYSVPLLLSRSMGRLSRGLLILSTMARLRRMERSTAPNEIVDFVLKNTAIQPAQVPAELHQFASIVAERNPKAVLEIGSFQGGTLLVLCRLSHPLATVISVDLPGGLFGGGYKWFRVPLFKSFVMSGQRLYLLRENSHKTETREKVTSILGDQRLDLLFIDGDHSYEGVRADFNLYSPLVRAGGIVAFHDIVEHRPAMGCEVARFWNETKRSYQHSEIIDNPGQGWGGLGLLYL
jgi:predicted O-methyltransferase YrrM